MKQFERKIDGDGRPYLETDLPGVMLTRLPLLNKGTAFPREERDAFGLHGLFPSHVSTLDEQVARAEANLRGFATDLDKHVYLRVLQDRNEVLFYALVERNLEEILPLIYTPTVAEAVEKFSQIYRHPRGLVVSTETIDRVDELLANVPQPDVRLAVATDSEGILGIGDQGFGGMAISIGKLSLYTAGAGVDPAVTLPIELDVGTDRADLREDPLYLGVRHARLRGQEYEAFMARFVKAFRARFPHALLQWEDFSKQPAFDLLDRYREELPSFNDDVQGTGAVVLAGLLAAARASGRDITTETFCIHGAGAGGVGVARQIVSGLRRAGLSEHDARRRVLVLDSRGLITEGRRGTDVYKGEVAQGAERIAGWSFGGEAPTLLETIREGGVAALIGLSGQRGAFDREVVQAVDRNTPVPIVLPLSNPTKHSEATPEDVLAWTDGRALVATGSPFADVVRGSTRTVIGQGNNAFVFPGLGLGAMLSDATRVSDGMLSAAAEALAEVVDPARLAQGALYPRVSRLRHVSRQVAVAVIRQAIQEGVARRTFDGEDLGEAVSAAMWEATYLPIRRPA
ncbi:MAG: NAD-dependent malic enzyme [Trueperaceae bacterium]|nr:NAD-dependent malic enzyme [Trueperaceae bacterium]